jgi:hypothetical protein
MVCGLDSQVCAWLPPHSPSNAAKTSSLDSAAPASGAITAKQMRPKIEEEYVTVSRAMIAFEYSRKKSPRFKAVSEHDLNMN